MTIQESAEMYLETIYILTRSKPDVHSIDVVDYMGFSKPSVSRAVKLLKENGYINVDENRHISLTDSGRRIAESMYDRHTILSKALISLGIDEETATMDACRIEHVISEESFQAIKKILSEIGSAPPSK